MAECLAALPSGHDKMHERLAACVARAASYGSVQDMQAFLQRHLALASAGVTGLRVVAEFTLETLEQAHPRSGDAKAALNGVAEAVLAGIRSCLGSEDLSRNQALLALALLKGLVAAGTCLGAVHAADSALLPAFVRLLPSSLGGPCSSTLCGVLEPLSNSFCGREDGLLRLAAAPAVQAVAAQCCSLREAFLSSLASDDTDTARHILPVVVSVVAAGLASWQQVRRAADRQRQASAGLQVPSTPAIREGLEPAAWIGGSAVGQGGAGATSEATLARSCHHVEGLLGMLLAATEGPDIRCRALAADAWMCMGQAHPTLEGVPWYRAELLHRLLASTLRGVAFPAAFSSWEEEATMDEDAFHQYREQQAVEVLEVVWQGVGPSPYCDSITDLLARSHTAGATWQDAEVAFFALRAVHLQVKSALRAARTAERTHLPVGTESGVVPSIDAALAAALRGLSPEIAAQWTWPLSVAAAKTAAVYAPWLSAHQQFIGAVGQFALAALHIEQVALPASQALLGLCVRCGKALATADSLQALAGGVLTCLHHSAGDLESSSNVLTGILRVLAHVSAAEACGTLRQLLGSLISQVKGAIDALSSPPTAPQVAAVHDAVQLAAVAVRFSGSMQRAEAAQLEALDIAVEGSSSIIHCIISLSLTEAMLPVAQACAELLAAVLAAAGGRRADTLPLILQCVARLYEGVRAPESVQVLSNCLEYYASGSIAAGQGSLDAATQTEADALLARNVQAVLQHGLSQTEATVDVGPLFELGSECLRWHPEALLGSEPVTSALYAAAAGVIGGASVAPRGVRSAIAFTRDLVRVPSSAGASGQRARVAQCLAACRGSVLKAVDAAGRAVLVALLSGVLVGGEGIPLTATSEALYHHLVAFHDAVAPLVISLLAEPPATSGLPVPASPLWGTLQGQVAQQLVRYASPAVHASAPQGTAAYLQVTPWETYSRVVEAASSVARGAAGMEAFAALPSPGEQPPEEAPSGQTKDVSRVLTFL